tara:strand:- start:107 stop:670 length:564 start_codon:yes stop_codon:yes gene_type:complete
MVRILLTPVFILSLFWENQLGHPIALFIFILACATDTYDGYYARKYNEITPEGKFLDPLADKILVSSAFISFAYLGIIEFWMVGLIIFRDLFITGLRMVIEQKGLSMVTSMIAKTKTTIQYLVIMFTLTILGLKSLPFFWVSDVMIFMGEYDILYYLTLFITIFTVYTGFTYLFENKTTIVEYMNEG